MDLVPPHAVCWLVAAVLVAAAVIDARTLKVPNALTFPFALAGLAASLLPGGVTPLESLGGLAAGLALLLPLYAVGGMGAGDVKLLAGVGAWIGPALVWEAFLLSAFAGAAIALVMIIASRRPLAHLKRIKEIALEWFLLRDPVVLSEIAAARKSSMTLLPYGIPIAAGTILLFVRTGLLA